MFLVLLFLLVVALCLLYAYLRPRVFIPPPGFIAPPECSSTVVGLLGTTFLAALPTEGFVSLLRHIVDVTGPIFTFYPLFPLARPVTIVTSLDLFRQGVGMPEASLSWQEGTGVKATAALGPRLASTYHDKQELHERKQTRVLLRGLVPSFDPRIRKCCKEMFSAVASSKESLDLRELMDILIGRINCANFCSLYDEKSADYVARLVRNLEETAFNLLALSLPDWLPFGPRAKAKLLLAEIKSLLEPFYDNACTEDGAPSYMKAVAGDHIVCDIPEMGSSAGDPFPKSHVIIKVIGIFFAARVNTLATVFWAALEIARNESVLRKLLEELDALPDDWKYSDIKNLPFLYACFVEAGNKAALLSFTSNRITTHDVCIGKYCIPKGHRVLFTPLLIARDPKLMGSDVEKFEPNRWLDADGRKRVQDCNLMFGGNYSVRQCKGDVIAEQVVLSILVDLFRNWRLEFVSGHNARVVSIGDFKRIPSEPVVVTLKRRLDTSERRDDAGD